MNVSTEGWKEALLESFIKFSHVKQLCLLKDNEADEVIISMFRRNSMCPMCRKAGFVSKEVPDCSKCMLTGFGQKPEFSCISQGVRGVPTIMTRFVEVLDNTQMDKDKRRDLLLKISEEIAARLHKALDMHVLRELEDFVL